MFRETCSILSGAKERIHSYAGGTYPDHVSAKPRGEFRCHLHPPFASGIRAERDQHCPVVHEPLPGNPLSDYPRGQRAAPRALGAVALACNVDTDARGCGGRKKLGSDVQAQQDNTALKIRMRRTATCNHTNE
jgi:hypothetical protein